MKNIYLALGILFTFALLYLMFINFDNISRIDLLTGAIVDTKTGIVMISCGVMGGIISSAIWGYFYQFAKSQQNKHLRAAEKATIKVEESTDKVKVLEAKIQTLEEALKKALESTH
ncbi:MAG: hypothetical protein AB1782_13280 [Cyanobacteriota bacterium]